MNKYILLILIHFLMYPLNPAVQGDKESEEVQGPVKTVTTEISTYIQDSTGVHFSPKVLSHKVSFLVNGYKSEETIYHPEGKFRIVYTYNSKNKKTKQTSYDSKGIISGHIDYTYDKDGNLSKEEAFSAQNKRVYLWKYRLLPAKNRMEIYYDSKNDVGYTGKTIHLYDNPHNRIKSQNYDWQGKPETSWEYDYDKLDRLIEQRGYAQVNTPYYTLTNSERDKQGNITLRTEKDAARQSYSAIRYEYKYDANNNWIEKKEIKVMDGTNTHLNRPISILYHTITYYP